MIDAATEIGLVEVNSVRETEDTTELGRFNPHLVALTAVNPESEHIPVTRVNGITSAITMPSGSLISGQVSLIHLDGWTTDEMGIKPAVIAGCSIGALMGAAYASGIPAKEMREPGDILKVAVGFTPTKVAEARETLQETKELGTKMDDARTSYSNKIVTALNKSQNATTPGDRKAYRREAEELMQEIREYDKGRPLRDRIIQDPDSFRSGILTKLKQMQQPQQPSRVPKSVRGEYVERLQE